jgi:drug/metabolite transporter (DMT)-like permease
MKVLGIVLIVVGILMFIVPGISFTKKEKVIDVGPLEVNKTTKEKVGWPMYAGGVAVAAGVILLVTSRKK